MCTDKFQTHWCKWFLFFVMLWVLLSLRATGQDSQQAARPHTAGPFSSPTQPGLCSAPTAWPRSPSSMGSRHVSGDPPGPAEGWHNLQVKGHVWNCSVNWGWKIYSGGGSALISIWNRNLSSTCSADFLTLVFKSSTRRRRRARFSFAALKMYDNSGLAESI